MKKKLLLWCATGLLFALTRTPAATHYVDAASTNAVPPFTNWANAAAVIQDAVDAAAPGDEIVVTNGVYQTGARAIYGMSNRVAVTKPMTVRSVNGPAVTSIVGHGPIGDNAIRCAYLTNGAVLAGFTLTNGATQESGGGAYCDAVSTVLSNCVIANCSAALDGGGVSSGTLNNCTLTGNSTINYGGGAFDSVLNNCIVTGNTVTGNESSPFANGGGGARGGTLNNCTLTGNSAFYGGGVIWSILTNCIITGNSAGLDNGAGGGANRATLVNCTLADNIAEDGGGAISSTLINCTVVGNSALVHGGGVSVSTLNNCIVYYNSAGWAGPNDYGASFNYSCTTPAPESGVGNITNAPLFVDTNGWSNLRLQSNSPCINAGNNAYVTAATDLDGLPRIAGGTVDIGAYEFQSPASTISYAWLQQSGLPTDGSADYVDTDHDGHNNWQEWVAGTDPTNALSVLSLASPVITPTNVTLTWTSVTNRTYTVEQATNLGGAPAFSVLRSNLAGLPGTTSWTDTNALVSSSRFYQLRVSP